MVGASGTSDTLGEWSLTNLRKGGFGGPIYPVNPRYEKLQGLRCYAALADLPEVPDLVVFGVGDARIEAALDEAIALLEGALVFGDEHEPSPLVLARLLP